jgi:hypothetical protein
MRRVRQLAANTPASRERLVDLLRAVSIILVVLGHWLATVIEYDDSGNLTGRSALPYLTWAHPVTWLVQVLPVFFLVGGFANAASLAGHRADPVGWLLRRSGRLVPPATVLVVTLAVVGFGVRLLGVEPELIRLAVWFASIPIWFLTAYLAVVLLTPLMYALHERFGLIVPLVLVGLVALGDLARLNGAGWLGGGSFLFGWLVVHQMGFAWRDERAGVPPGRGLRYRRLPARAAVPLVVVGLAGLLLLTLLGPYPVSMINIPGERLHNMSPPTLALLSLATAQLGLILLLRDPVERWLDRARPWRFTIAVNSVVLTAFLWHVTAILLVVGVLHALNLLPTSPVGSSSWWLWRLPWLIMGAAALAVLVALLARFEARGTPTSRPRWLPAAVAVWLRRPGPRAVLTTAGYGGVILGLLDNSLAPSDGSYLFGLPTRALVAYLFGAALLHLLRSASPPSRPA